MNKEQYQRIMKKEFVGTLLAGAILFFAFGLVLYGFGAFIHTSFDITKWHIATRVAIAFLMFCWFIIVCIGGGSEYL